MQEPTHHQNEWRTWGIRFFLVSLITCILIDTSPSHFTQLNFFRKPLNVGLNALGLGQGDWPLFAPNPVINNNTLIAEIEDCNHNRFQWSSPDWSQQSVWFKFHQFRQMNYFQRVGRYPLAYENLAIYLARAVPIKQPVKPLLDFSKPLDELNAPTLTKPLLQLTLNQAQFEMVLPEDTEHPNTEDIFWSYKLQLLWHLGPEGLGP
jgi:hypothetical protein